MTSGRISASRRRLLAAAAVGTGWLVARPLTAFAATLTPTPAQTTGPFYPRELPLDRDADLASVAGARARAQGTLTHIFGTVRDVDGRPIRGARVEIWQCNAFGRYHHPNDRRSAPLDPGFQGFGETVTGDDGRYRFRTIKPVPYPGRTPHIHFAVVAPGGSRLVTQMYIDGEPGNARDGLLNSIRDEAARRSVIVPLKPAPEIEADALAGAFEIVLGGNARAG